MAKKLTKSKAKEILHDKSVHGHPLTDKQRRFFGAIAGGAKPYKAQNGFIGPSEDESGETDFLRKWMDSPKYKQMLTKSTVSPEEFKTIASGRLENINRPYTKSEIKEDDILNQGNIASTNILYSPRQYANPFIPGSVDRPSEKIGFDVRYSPEKFASVSPLERASILIHERSHTSDMDFYDPYNPETSIIPAKDREMIGSRDELTGYKRYLKNPTEVRARLNELRFLGKDLGVYDPFNESINLEQLKQLNKKIPFSKTRGASPYEELRELYTPEEIVNLLNSVSKVSKGDIDQAQNGIEGTMGGLTDKGFNYNGAWGGTMQNGGKVNDPITPYSRDYINNFRNQWVAHYNQPAPSLLEDDKFDDFFHKKQTEIPLVPTFYTGWLKKFPDGSNEKRAGDKNNPPKSMGKPTKGFEWVENFPDIPERSSGNIEKLSTLIRAVRNAEFKKPEWNRAVRFNSGGNIMPAMAGANQTVSMAQLGDSVKPIPMQLAMGGSLPGAVGFTYARTVGAAPSNGPYAKKTKASAQNGQEMKFYQAGLDFKPKTISQDGSEIPVDSMGYWNPDNWGNPVIIPSTDITMEGVDVPLIGISDTGDVQYMEPGEDYQFEGDYVTEYPVAQRGKKVYSSKDIKAKPPYPEYPEGDPRRHGLFNKYSKQPEPIFVDNPNDPRLKNYQDSLSLYNDYLKDVKWAADYYRTNVKNVLKGFEHLRRPIGSKEYKEHYNWIKKHPKEEKSHPTIKPTAIYDFGEHAFTGTKEYKKPVQPVKYKKPEPKPVEQPKVVEKPAAAEQPAAKPKYQMKGDAPIYGPNNSLIGMFNWDTQEFYPDYENTAGRRSANQKDIDLLNNAEELSSFLRRKGAYSPKIISKQRNGGVNNADAQPLKKLDQLLNFTNYNKPTKNNWLDKYN